MNRIPPDSPILTAAAMRATEDTAFARGVSQHVLMERAGSAVAREVARYAAGRPILVACGPGNNGGDGHIAARLLREWGHDVIVASLGPRGSGAAFDAARAWQGETLSFVDAGPRAVLVDALFGIGLTRPIEADVARQMGTLRAGAAWRVAVDIASGIGADRGDDLGHAGPRADLTVALGALKPGHLVGQGGNVSGHVVLAELGIDIDRRWRTIARPMLSAPSRTAHKYSRGLVLVRGGTMPGAARLAARAAATGGAGYVRLASHHDAASGYDAIVPVAADGSEFEDARIGAVVIGPGLGRDAEAARALRAAIDSDHRLVIDGDALSLLGRDASTRLAGRRAATVLTPHDGEFARMFDETGDRIGDTLAAARATGATIVRKGAATVIADAAGEVRICADAPSWLASAGTGDVLAGIVAARLAAGEGVGASGAAATAVWLHARAARLCGPAFVADRLIDHLPAGIGECL